MVNNISSEEVKSKMKNSDVKVSGLYFRLAVTGNRTKVACERRYKEFEYLR